MKSYIYILLLLLLSCANVVPPSGGPLDKSPPVVISFNPENSTVGFQQNKIIIYFDENIVIRNRAAIHTLPEPNLIEKITITGKGKGLEIYLTGDLKENTTYVIDFQDAIADLNEGNKLDNLKYIFSTGENIDSSIVHGKVTELEYNRVIKNSLVGLYIGDITEEFDSLIRVKKPDFFCFTDQSGRYNYSNLKNGTYTLMCIKDDNLNLKYEKNELVSMPKLIHLKDSMETNITVFLDERYNDLMQANDSIKDTIHENPRIELGFGLLNLFFNYEIYHAKNYIGQITQKNNVIRNFNIRDSVVIIDSINEGIYQLKLIQDLNNNEKWDSGNIKSLKSPEKIFFFKDSIQIRSNWELNLNIDI